MSEPERRNVHAIAIGVSRMIRGNERATRFRQSSSRSLVSAPIAFGAPLGMTDLLSTGGDKEPSNVRT